MGVQTQADSGDDCHFNYEEILSPEELQELEEEFRPRLKNACFLDHAGATLYASSQIDAYQSELQSNLFSNPHSRNPSSSITTDAIDCVRLRSLRHTVEQPRGWIQFQGENL
ncbi:unnamed protein product [Allacma fusca]|uniref:Uncharacterized protein n=1 Tax=Allacma fusca TaxID=39272 RepID=A0A8J2PSG7_9HEXA|nr:unnamed protein product [Allacma fusca]